VSAHGGNDFPEIGGIVHMDHVNFLAPDQDMATRFFIGGLGLARDPYQRVDETNMGVNVGMEQFHLPRRGAATPPFHGKIGLVVPRIDVIGVRLERLARMGGFDGTAYTFEPGTGEALVRAPFGYLLHLHEAGTIPFQRPLGIAYVDVAVPPGVSAAIGRFYADMFGAPVATTRHDGAPAAVVATGPFQTWRFVERDLADHDTHAMHVSFYATDFAAIRARLVAAGATDGGARDHVFSFDRIFDPETGRTVFTVNNEVRSLYHPDFRRPLANRWPIADGPFSEPAPVEAEVGDALGPVPGR
jgi:hypothetical protein